MHVCIYVCMYIFFIALRAKGWESSKDIGNPAYQCERFAARLILGLLNAYVLNPKVVRHTCMYACMYVCMYVCMYICNTNRVAF